MRRLGALALVVLGFASTVEALTVRDVIELSRAGLGEDVLLALIEVDGGVYAIDADTLKSLKRAGVPERVIVALVRSGRERLPDPAASVAPVAEPPPPQPQVVVIEHRDEPVIREVMVPVPIYVPVLSGRARHPYSRVRSDRSQPENTFIPFQSGPPVVRPTAPEPKREPVYWGFGGKLRPDAWQPDGHKRESVKPSDRK